MSTIEAGKNPRDIILKPVTTEKSLALMDLGKYTFEVDPRANKTEIKIALERIFGVKIGSIFGDRYKARAEFFGGLVLIVMGLKILIEHFLE